MKLGEYRGRIQSNQQESFKSNSLGTFLEKSRRLQRAHAVLWRWGTQVRAPGYPRFEDFKDMTLGEYRGHI